jgi:transposase
MFERIRRDQRDEGLSIRALAERHEVHRRTVRQALGDATPPTRKVPVRTSPVLGEHEARVRTWLTEDLLAPRKQRHTARRVWQRLRDEHGAQLAESSVRALVARLRAELAASTRVVPIVQEHPVGEEAEVDFGEFMAWIDGAYLKLWMFALRLSHSGRAVHVAYANQAQESFFDGHVHAFEVLGGVPTGKVRYDNLKPAVIRVLLGRERLENPRFIALRSHYGYDSFFCEPGIGGAHEKGGVEGEVGRFRRQHLTPVPIAASLAELNDRMAAADLADQDRRIAARTETVGQAAARELPSLRPLPVEAFDVSTLLSCKVDAKARICVRQSYYSVPAHLAGARVSVALGARGFTVRDARPGRPSSVVATHVRSLHKNTQDLVLDHYLEVLARRPGALPAASALATARAAGLFTEVHDRFWSVARRQLGGDSAGTRALIEVLLLHRTLPREAVLAGIEAALRLDRADVHVVAVEARRHLEPAKPLPHSNNTGVNGPGHDQPPTGGERPPPTLRGYDTLLRPADAPAAAALTPSPLEVSA